MIDERPLVVLKSTCDRYGYVGILYDGFFDYPTGLDLDDLGPHSRQWWRNYCRSRGYKLREVR